MPPPHHHESLLATQQEMDTFIRSLVHATVVEDEVEIFDLTSARWKLTVEFGKLIFEAWNDSRSIARRVESIAYRDGRRLGVFVRKPGGRERGALEFRDLAFPERSSRTQGASRTRFRKALVEFIARAYRGCRLERVSSASDLEHSFSTWYTRGLARQGTAGWAFLGLAEEESPAAGDAALAHGLIWLDWLRAHSGRTTVAGLKLFLPPSAVSSTGHRASCLNHRAAQIEIWEWRSNQTSATPVDYRDYGNVETALTHRRRSELLTDAHRPILLELLGESLKQMDLVPDAHGHSTSLRIRGLEVARVENQILPQVFFGLEGAVQKLGQDNAAEFREFVRRVFEMRDARSRNKRHEFYRLQSERWLESLLLRDIARVDAELVPDRVYPQVPAFSAKDRGVIDILGVTRRGRLAVIELKVQEEINLPVQGLDYWMRVKWLLERGQFQEYGYFRGMELSTESPLLYLVSPAFRFHSTTDRIIRYFDPSIQIIQVGLNDQWREGPQVLFRRDLPPA